MSTHSSRERGAADADAFRFYAWAHAIAQLTDVTPSAKLVAYALAHANARTGQCNPSQERLAASIGASRRTVSAAIANLRRIGAIRVEHGAGNRASYQLVQMREREAA
jgi:biotin operon repressor